MTSSSALISAAPCTRSCSNARIVQPLFTRGQPPVARGLFRAGFPILIRAMRRLRRSTRRRRRKPRRDGRGQDRLEAELQPNGYLVGESFSVADLTAASLFYPAVLPPEFPYPLVAEVPEPGREFIAGLAERPGGRWVADMYARHRVAAGATRRVL